MTAEVVRLPAPAASRVACDGQDAAFLALFLELDPRSRGALPAMLEAVKEGSRPFEEIAIEFYVACGLTRQEAVETAETAKAKLSSYRLQNGAARPDACLDGSVARMGENDAEGQNRGR